MSGHSVTLQETVAVSSAEISGATAFEVSGMTQYLCSLSYFLFFSFPEVFIYVVGSVSFGFCLYDGVHM